MKKNVCQINRIVSVLLVGFFVIAFSCINAIATQEDPVQTADLVDTGAIIEDEEPFEEVPNEMNSARVSISGNNITEENTVVNYTISVTNVEKLSIVTVLFEVDGSFVEGNGFEGLNGFQILDAPIDWVKKGGDILEARVTLVSLDNSLTSNTPVDILSMSLKARDNLGISEIKITDVRLSSRDNSNQEVYIDCDFEDSLIELEITQFYSLYDVDRDGFVSQLDLTLDQLYYTDEENGDNWNMAERADVNSDGVVDIADFVLIMRNINW